MTEPLQAFPATADEFYRLRDDRTEQYPGVASDYQAKSVCVTADPSVIRSFGGQVMFIVSVNLLARWCRTVVLAVPDALTQAQVGPAGSLLDLAVACMKDADPFGSFFVGTPGLCDLHLHIGGECPESRVRTTIISADGWCAAVRRPGAPALGGYDRSNPVGAVAAAILGGAQVFRDALDREELYAPTFIFDAFSARPVAQVIRRPWLQSRRLEFGKLLMAGAGSVGSSAAYFMRMFGLRGLMRIVDGDFAKVENISRSPMFGRNLHGWGKASAIKQGVAGDGLVVEAEDIWWRELDSCSMAGYDVIIPVANEDNIRWEIQTGYPPLMIHASTGRNWNVNFGRHIPGVDDCLADRFAGFGERPTFRCSTGKVSVSRSVNVDAALPFLSFFAGFLIATDLARLGARGYPHTPNYGEYSFRLNRFAPQLHAEKSRQDCLCRSQAIGFWRFRKETRYSGLSPLTWT